MGTDESAMPDLVSLNQIKPSLNRFQLSISCLYSGLVKLVFTSHMATCHVTTLYVICGTDIVLRWNNTLHTLSVKAHKEQQHCHYKILMCGFPSTLKPKHLKACRLNNHRTLTAECKVNENVVEEPAYQPVWCH